MAITAKQVVLWRKEVENKPGELARVLEPVAKSGTNLQIVMGYSYPGDAAKAAVEVYPVSGKKAVVAAESAGLHASSIPALMIEGNNKAGLGHAIAKALADAGINVNFLVAQVIGRKYSAVFGFENDVDTRKAVSVIKKVAK
jgi:hypothetical protein